MTRRPVPTMTPEEARRAIYLDVEMRVKEPPALTGIDIEGAFDQVVHDAGLAAAARASRRKRHPFAETMEGLLRRAEQDDRLLVAYSEHELHLMRDFAGLDPGHRYRNARAIAERWMKDRRPTWRRRDMSLKALLRKIRYPRPERLGAGEPARWIQEVGDMLSDGREFGELTALKKAAWRDLLLHNRHDVQGMRELMLRAAAELAGAET